MNLRISDSFLTCTKLRGNILNSATNFMLSENDSAAVNLKFR